MQPNGWWYQAVRERDGTASTTKVQRLIAFAVSTIIILYQVWKEAIPSYLPELLGVYLGYAVLGRASSKWIEHRRDKNGSDSSSSTTSS